MHFDDIYDLVDAVVDRFSYEEDKYDKKSRCRYAIRVCRCRI